MPYKVVIAPQLEMGTTEIYLQMMEEKGWALISLSENSYPLTLKSVQRSRTYVFRKVGRKEDDKR